MYSIADINIKKPVGSLLTVVEFGGVEDKGKIRRVVCYCKCGNVITTRMTSVISGKAVSCGCQHKSQYKKLSNEKKKSVKHSEYHCYLTGVYRGMISRCYNYKNAAYKNYGAKGVVVCDEWKNSYQSFLTWALNNGWKTGLCLDKDIKGDGKLYSPETCKFVTYRENLLARPMTRKTIFNGMEISITELSDISNVPYGCLYYNIIKLGTPADLYIPQYKPKNKIA